MIALGLTGAFGAHLAPLAMHRDDDAPVQDRDGEPVALLEL